MKSILARLAVLTAVFAAVLAASVAAVATPAAAAPTTPTAITCWNEFDTVKIGQTIYASAFKDCTHLSEPQALSLTLQIYVCDEFGGGCFWATWKSGSGVVSYTCPGTFYAAFRNSRLPNKIVYCDYS
jgi:hypothetical protein